MTKVKKRHNHADDLEVVDSSGLMDADWTEINKLRCAYERGGSRTLNSALKKLSADPIRYMMVIGAFFPEMVREALLDSLAEAGMTQDDVRKLIREPEKPASLH